MYARVALCTDLEVIDDYPSHYLTWVARLHRWVRGDWQLLPWLWRTVPTQSGARVRNVLPAVSRWKIADNLRRSLLPLALIVLLTAGWLVLPGGPSLWTGTAFLVLFFPAYVQWGQTFANRVRGVRLRDHFRSERDNLASSLHQVLLHSAFLAHQSVVMVDAIGRTLVRLVTKRHLLEWETAADTAARLQGEWPLVLRRMWVAPVMAVLLAPGRDCAAAVECVVGAAGAHAVGHLAVLRLSHGPAEARRPAGARGSRAPRAAPHGAADVALLRGSGHRGRQLARARTTIRRTGPTRSRTARRRPTSACR